MFYLHFINWKTPILTLALEVIRSELPLKSILKLQEVLQHVNLMLYWLTSFKVTKNWNVTQQTRYLEITSVSVGMIETEILRFVSVMIADLVLGGISVIRQTSHISLALLVSVIGLRWSKIWQLTKHRTLCLSKQKY